jgi:hypothetical protein
MIHIQKGATEFSIPAAEGEYALYSPGLKSESPTGRQPAGIAASDTTQ